MSARERPTSYRELASDDPHGTRAIAMALPQKIREQLAHRGPKPKHWVVLVALFPMQMGMQLVLAGHPWFVAVPLFGVSVLALHFRSLLLGARVQVTERQLVVTGPLGHLESFPWTKVESFEPRLLGARVKIRVGESLVTRYALRNAFDQRPVPAAPPQWIPTEVRELAGGARRSVATVFGSIGVVVFSIAAGIALATHVGTGGWMAMLGSALAYALLAAGIASRSQLTARPDGLHLPRRVIAWDQIEEAAPHGGAGSSEIRIRVAGEDPFTVFCGDADRAVEEITERRNIARRMRAERGT